MRVDFFKLYTSKKFCTLKRFRDNQIFDYVLRSFKAPYLICALPEFSTLTDLLHDYAAPDTPSIRRKATVRIKNLTSTAVIRIYLPPKRAQIQLENHHMVILNIPKNATNVNVFQKRFNNLLIFNNFFLPFLAKMTLR